jgi:hypothetical protein
VAGRKLKVFQAQFGFYDTVVAAPSQAADSPATSNIARDIAESFLREAPSPAATQQISALINDVKGSSTPGYVPQSPAYAVFAGAGQTPIEMDLPGSRFVIAPSREGGGAAIDGDVRDSVVAGAPAVSLSFAAPLDCSRSHCAITSANTGIVRTIEYSG